MNEVIILVQMYNPYRGILIQVTYKYIKRWEDLGFIQIINNIRFKHKWLN